MSFPPKLHHLSAKEYADDARLAFARNRGSELIFRAITILQLPSPASEIPRKGVIFTSTNPLKTCNFHIHKSFEFSHKNSTIQSRQRHPDYGIIRTMAEPKDILVLVNTPGFEPAYEVIFDCARRHNWRLSIEERLDPLRHPRGERARGRALHGAGVPPRGVLRHGIAVPKRGAEQDIR